MATTGHESEIVNIAGLKGTLQQYKTSISDNKLSTSLKGANNGLATLDSTGKVPSSQLPSQGQAFSPDEEDLTVSDNLIKFKDKTYETASYSGLGRKYLRKNMVNGVNTLIQSMMSSTDTIYVIQYDYILAGDITVPVNSILEFEGGSISGSYTVNTNYCVIRGLVKNINTSVFKGEYTLEKIVHETSVNLNNYVVVKTGEELAEVLHSNTEYDSILLKGGRFVLPSSLTQINASGIVKPFAGYKPEIYASGIELKNFVKEQGSGLYKCSVGRALNSHMFYAFDSNGNSLRINALSDVLNADIAHSDGDITISGNVAIIPMDSATRAIIADKNTAFFSNATLIVHSWYMTYVFDSFYTDSNNIYGTYTGIFDLSLINHDKSTYGFSNTRFDIFNLPLGNKNVYVDSSNICYSEDALESILICDNSSLVTINSTKLRFYDITFKGSNRYILCAANTVFKNCIFTEMNYGPYCSDACTITGCKFINIGTQAVEMDYAGSNLVTENCYFKNVGIRNLKSIVIQARGTSIVRDCHLCDFTYIGIDCKETCTVVNNVLESPNFSRNTEKYCLLDGGAIYVIGFFGGGMSISKNIIRHIKARGGKDYRGIFLDDGASGVSCTENIIYDTSDYAIDSRYVANGENKNNLNNHFNNNVCIGDIRIEGNTELSTSESMPEISNNIFSKVHSFKINTRWQNVNTTRFHYLTVDSNGIIYGEKARNNDNWGAPISHTDFINRFFIEGCQTPQPKIYTHFATSSNYANKYYIRMYIPCFEDGMQDNDFFLKAHINVTNSNKKEVIDIPPIYFNLATNNILSAQPSSAVAACSPGKSCYMEYVNGLMGSNVIRLDFGFYITTAGDTSIGFVVDEMTWQGCDGCSSALRSPYPDSIDFISNATSTFNSLVTFATPT